MSNYKTVFFTLGILQIILGISMFIPIIAQFIYSEIDSSFFGASIVTIIFGSLFFLSNLDHDKKLNLQQAFLLTALSWLSIAIFGSLPFIFSTIELSITDSFFESMSGITTTGSTIISDLENAFSKSEIIVDPVVVIPDILSKKESVIESSIVENINGKDPKIAILNQDKAVNKNACCKFNFLSWSRFERKNNDPKMIVTIDAPKNDESISE